MSEEDAPDFGGILFISPYIGLIEVLSVSLAVLSVYLKLYRSKQPFYQSIHFRFATSSFHYKSHYLPFSRSIWSYIGQFHLFIGLIEHISVKPSILSV